jgi:hypothetical protein
MPFECGSVAVCYRALAFSGWRPTIRREKIVPKKWKRIYRNGREYNPLLLIIEKCYLKKCNVIFSPVYYAASIQIINRRRISKEKNFIVGPTDFSER